MLWPFEDLRMRTDLNHQKHERSLLWCWGEFLFLQSGPYLRTWTAFRLWCITFRRQTFRWQRGKADFITLHRSSKHRPHSSDLNISSLYNIHSTVSVKEDQLCWVSQKLLLKEAGGDYWKSFNAEHMWLWSRWPAKSFKWKFPLIFTVQSWGQIKRCWGVCSKYFLSGLAANKGSIFLDTYLSTARKLYNRRQWKDPKR